MQNFKKIPLSIRMQPTSHLGSWTIDQRTFSGIEEVFEQFKQQEYLSLHEKQKTDWVSHVLVSLIREVEEPCFLLPAMIDFFDRIRKHNVLDHHYTIYSFELYLNQVSKLSAEENLHIRAKIAGKWIPRDRYQALFPVGSGKVYRGSHFVTAHSSPDLDTTVASFWGWLDAFSCRISENFHVWNVPGGAPQGQVEINFLFKQLLGEHIFDHLAKTRTALGVTGMDLMTQEGMVRKAVNYPFQDIDQERSQHAVVLVDERGYYLGDWRNFDVEGVRQVIMLLCNCLRWFEHHLQLKFISLFAKEELSIHDLPQFLNCVLGLRICDSAPVVEFTFRQKVHVESFLSKVLKVSNGLESTFEGFARAMKGLSIGEFQEFIDEVESIQSSALFDSHGKLIEQRPRIFHYLEKIIVGLDKAIQAVRDYVDRLDVALSIKTQVFGYLPQVVSSRADLEEIRSKMGSYPYLTVTATDGVGELIPLGIIPASAIYQSILGTVTLRDFCNREETKIPSYLEVISVIDHHKSVLQTTSTAVVTISDAQSSNGMVAELACKINDSFSMGGMTPGEITAQIEQVGQDLASPSNKRIFQRLLQRQMVAERKESYFIDPERELIEYLHFLYAILDDTDLLTKVSVRDLECVASLLNRMKSLVLGKEVEIVHFDGISRGAQFVAQAVRRILENADMYSLYRKIYLAKEEAVDRNIKLCAQEKPSTFFADTKEQNGCSRIGQTKMFIKNVPVFIQHVMAIRKSWQKEAMESFREHRELDLHMHMISTVTGAEEMFAGTGQVSTHTDELWIWIPQQDAGIEHLKTFLNGFQNLPGLQDALVEVEFVGKDTRELEQVFAESFLATPSKTSSSEFSMAILRFKAGTINSRKAQISPYLPRLIN